MDITRGEKVEQELDVIIGRRHERRIEDEGERQAHELWAASVERYNSQHARAALLDRIEYHQRMASSHRATLTDLVNHHVVEAERCRERLGMTT